MYWVVDALFLIPGLYIGVVTAYLVLLSAAACFARKPGASGAPLLQIAVVIPAHNEERQIGAVLSSLYASPYPRDRFTVFVIADNCEDRTAEIASELGAVAVERKDPLHPGKGQALHWFLGEKAEVLRTFDAIAIVDADCFVGPSFIPEISASFGDPQVSVVQAYNGVANPGENWRTALTFAGFAGVNHVRPAGQDRLGGAPPLRGTGMAFRTDVLLRYGWPAHSIVEDMEFTVQLVLDGVRVRYNGDATVTSDMPARAKQAGSQRRRWEGGRLQILLRYWPRLLKAFLAEPEWRYLDALLELMAPPLSLLALWIAVYLAAALTLGKLLWSALATVCVLGIVFYVCTALCLRKAPLKVWISLALAPLFVLWKIPIYVGLLLRKEKTWVRTPRESEAGKKDVC